LDGIKGDRCDELIKLFDLKGKWGPSSKSLVPPPP
jgi:hypothetical protein